MRTLEAWVLGYLLNSLWQLPFVVAAGWVAARLLRQSGPRFEHRVWVGALLLAVPLPACSLPALPMRLHLVEFMHMLWGGAHAPEGRHAQVATVADIAERHSTVWLPSGLLAAIVAAYLGSLLFFSIRLVWGLWKTTAMRQRAEPVVLAGEAARSWKLCCETFEVQGARLAVSRHLSSPVVVGLRSRLLLLPPGFLETVAPDDLLAAFAHEFAHMQRRDVGKNFLYALLSLPLCPHPALWFLRVQIAETREMVCDRMAAQVLKGSGSYARSLLRLAAVLAHPRPALTLHAIGIFDANALERRVMQLTQKQLEIKGARRFASGAAGILLSVATCASALTLRLDIGNSALMAPSFRQAQDSSADDAKRGYTKDGDVYTPKPGGPIDGPKLTYSMDPSFPKHAGRVTGVCVVSTIVNTDGKPEQVKVTKSLRKDFDEKAIKAVEQYRFEPATLDGKPVRERISIEINFQRF